MEDMIVSASAHDFSGVRAAMQHYVDQDILAGVSYAVLEGRALVDLQCVGWADRESRTPLRADHLFRIFSNTKLVTSCAVLLLMEDGLLALEDPIGAYLPQLARPRVLKPGASSLDDTEPASGPITIRHLLSHSAGLSYGLLDPGSLMYKAYVERKMLNPATPLAAMMDVLSELPLLFHPGTSWEYSVASDVLARLVEVLSGQRFDAFLQQRIFAPLGMVDTGFVVPEGERVRLTAYYRGADALDPMKPGLTRIDNSPYPGAYLKEMPRLSGGGGLVSSLPDMVALLRSLLPGGPALLKPATMAAAMRGQLADGVTLRFASGSLAGKVHGLLGAVTLAPSPLDPADSVGELQWGGIAGTHWWISPQTGLAAVLMTQRQMAFWNPYAFDFKRQVYQAAGRAA
ncbi:MAG: serine hydrolase domain-containing protein [Noviherbaspirillum sp.]